MAGNVTPIRAGGQVAYRLGGDAELEAGQVAYRLGEQNDARQVFWIGDGPTAQALGVTPGETVTGADVGRVYALMDGVNPETGEVLVAPKVAVAESAKLPAVPAYDAIVWAAAERGRSAEDLFSGRDRKDWEAFARQVQAKGDTYRVPVERIETLGEAARVRVEAAYGVKAWADAVESKGQRVPVGIKGYDVGLTLTKGASLGLVLAEGQQREQLAQIARQAAQETYRELGERVAYGATGHHGGGQVAARIDGSGFAGTATMEVTSRADDPHVHFHAMIANLTICEDGKARTIGAGGRDVLAHGAWASERFRMKYREATTAAGLVEWGWNEATGEYDQLDISADARALASKRHAAIAAEKDIFGSDAGTLIDAMSERITRESKSETVETLAEVAARFSAELGEKNLELRGDSELVGDEVAGWYLDDWIVYLDAKLTEHNAVFTRVQVETQIQRRWPAHQLDQAERDVQAVTDAYLAHHETLEVTQTVMSGRLTDGTRYTTKAMLDGEKTVYETTANGVGAGFHTLTPAAAEMALQTYEAAEGFTLNQGQRAMFMRWVIGGNQVDLTIGAAGTGKTAAAEAARFAYEAAGLKVLGISTSGLAAQNLGAAAGIEVTTAFGLAKAIQEGRAPEIDALMWDEMAMASTREQAVILPWAATNHVDVRGMGDPKQLDSVGAGSTYGKQCEQVGAGELVENMRQQHVHEREAVAQLRTGDVGLALGIYADAGQISVCKTPEDRIALMAANWARDAETVSDPHERLKQAVMLSQTNATVEQLHDAARTEARDRGWITGPDTEYRGPNGPRSWAVGDAILIRQTIHSGRRDRAPAIFNGQRAIVTGIDPATRAMSIEWKDAGGALRTRNLAADYVAGHIAAGFALTNHGAQGQSIRFVHADPSGVDRNAAYTQTTRSVERVDLYTDLNTLGISGKSRVDVLRMNDQARAQWAAAQLAERIEDRGWQAGETAHDATDTPIPASPTVTGDPQRRERLLELLAKSTVSTPRPAAAQTPEPPQSQPRQAGKQPPDTRPEFVRQAFPDPQPAAPAAMAPAATQATRANADPAYQQMKAQFAKERAAQQAALAQRPYWKWTPAEIKAEIEKAKTTITGVEGLAARQGALDAKRGQLGEIKTRAERQWAEHVQRANNNAKALAGNAKEWQREAADLVRQAEQPLQQAEDQARHNPKGLKHRKAERQAEAAREQLAATFPTAGDPGHDYSQRQAWRTQATAETIQRLHGDQAQQWRQVFTRQDPATITALAQDQDSAAQLRNQLPRAEHEYGNRKKDWQTYQRRPANYHQAIETQAERWQSADPGALARSADSYAIESEARHKQLTDTIDTAQRRIDHTQRTLDAAPAAAATAQERLQGLTREWAIRQAQPETTRSLEQQQRHDIRAKEAADLVRQAQQQRETEASQRHHYHHREGPNQGPGLSM